MKTNNNIFIKSLIVFFAVVSLANVTLSQGSSQNNGLKEFDDVKIYKPTSGFLKMNMNRTIKENEGVEEMIFQPYKIYDSNGKLYCIVHQSYYEPITITLPAGTYYIKTKNITDVRSKFGVEIQAGKTTLVE